MQTAPASPSYLKLVALLRETGVCSEGAVGGAHDSRALTGRPDSGRSAFIADLTLGLGRVVHDYLTDR